MGAPNISLFSRVSRTRAYKGYRTCMRAPNISLFPRVIGPV